MSFQITNPARGRKQFCGLGHFHFLFPPVSNHKPRKGTETRFSIARSMSARSSFQITNPARGRKLFHGLGHFHFLFPPVSNHKPRKGTETNWLDAQFGRNSAKVSNHKPRKGTETVNFIFVSSFLAVCFKSQTPQGDGNRLRSRCDSATSRSVSNHKPRKGTETTSAAPSINRQRGFKSQTPQGDGNVTSLSSFSSCNFSFQITNPARGRKPDSLRA